jgi:hypothetical protein
LIILVPFEYTVPQEVQDQFSELVQLYLACVNPLTPESDALKLIDILLFTHVAEEFVALTTGFVLSIFHTLYDAVLVLPALSLIVIDPEVFHVNILEYVFHTLAHEAIQTILHQLDQ